MAKHAALCFCDTSEILRCPDLSVNAEISLDLQSQCSAEERKVQAICSLFCQCQWFQYLQFYCEIESWKLSAFDIDLFSVW